MFITELFKLKKTILPVAFVQCKYLFAIKAMEKINILYLIRVIYLYIYIYANEVLISL